MWKLSESKAKNLESEYNTTETMIKIKTGLILSNIIVSYIYVYNS